MGNGQSLGRLVLFLVVNVVRKLGGLVVASNRAEGGSSVALTLPLPDPAVGCLEGKARKENR